jgi:hypothetical protein
MTTPKLRHDNRLETLADKTTTASLHECSDYTVRANDEAQRHDVEHPGEAKAAGVAAGIRLAASAARRGFADEPRDVWSVSSNDALGVSSHYLVGTFAEVRDRLTRLAEDDPS